MQGDFDKVTYNSAKHYISVLLQQGRVQLPSDFNEALEILLRLIENSNLDEKGKSGSPNDGFKIGELIPVDHMDKIEDDNVTTISTDINNSDLNSDHFVMQEGKSCIKVINATSLKREYKNKINISNARKLFFVLSDLLEDSGTLIIPEEFKILVNDTIIAERDDIKTRPKDGNKRWSFCWIDLYDKAAGRLDLTSVYSISFQWKNPLDLIFDFIATDYRHPIIPWNADYRHPYWLGSFDASKDLDILDNNDGSLLFLGQPNLSCKEALKSKSFTWNYQIPKRFMIDEGDNNYIPICREIIISLSKKPDNDFKITFVNAYNGKQVSIGQHQPPEEITTPNGIQWYICQFLIADISDNDKDAIMLVKSLILENIPIPCEIAEIIATPDLSHDFIIVGSTNMKENAGKFYCNGKLCKKEFHETYLTQIDYPDPYPLPTLFSLVNMDKKFYQVGDQVKITVKDANANTNVGNTIEKSINLLIITGTDKDGIIIQATKTQDNSNIFEGYINIVSKNTLHPGNNEIKGSDGDKLTIIYRDKIRATAKIFLKKQPLPYSPDRKLFVYLDAWERHITTIEDKALKEVALGSSGGGAGGGPDTTTRLKQICQTRFLTEDFLDQQKDKNNLNNLEDKFYEKLNEITPTGTGRLSTLTKEAEANTDPCAIEPIAGYEGDNRLYRVEIHKGGKLGNSSFKWSEDNGSIVTRITGFGAEEEAKVSKGVTKVSVESLGRDRDTMFKIGDYIEITDDITDLADYIQNPTLEAGEIRQITDVDVDQNILGWDSPKIDFLYSPLIGDYNLFRNAKVRKWNGIGKTEKDPEKTDDTTSNKFVNPQLHLDKGIMLDFSSDGEFRTGDYWIFKTRALTREIDKLVKAFPMGPIHKFSRLAHFSSWLDKCDLIQENIDDFRIIFPPLTDITASDVLFDNSVCNLYDERLIITVQQAIEELCRQRHGSLCSVVVSEYTGKGIQKAIDSLRETGGVVCIPKGIYKVIDPIIIQGNGITLQGEGVSTIIDANDSDWNSDSSIFLIDGTGSDSSNITIKDLVASTMKSSIISINQTIGFSLLNCILVHKQISQNTVLPALNISGITSDVKIKDNFIIASQGIGFDSEGRVSNLNIVDNKMFCHDSIITTSILINTDSQSVFDINSNWEIKNNWMSGLGKDLFSLDKMDLGILLKYINKLLLFTENRGVSNIGFPLDPNQPLNEIATTNNGIYLIGSFKHLIIEENKVFAKNIGFLLSSNNSNSFDIPTTKNLSKILSIEDVTLNKNFLYSETGTYDTGSVIYLRNGIDISITGNQIVSCNPFSGRSIQNISKEYCRGIGFSGILVNVVVSDNIFVGKVGIYMDYNYNVTNKNINDNTDILSTNYNRLLLVALKIITLTAASMSTVIWSLNVKDNFFYCSKSCIIEGKSTVSFGSVERNLFCGLEGPAINLQGTGFSNIAEPHYTVDNNGFLVMGAAINLGGGTSGNIYINKNKINVIAPLNKVKGTTDTAFNYANTGYGIICAQSNVFIEENLINVSSFRESLPYSPLGGILVGNPNQSVITFKIPENIEFIYIVGYNDVNSIIQTVIPGNNFVAQTNIDPGVYRLILKEHNSETRLTTDPFIIEPGINLQCNIQVVENKFYLDNDPLILLNTERLKGITIRNNNITHGSGNGITIANYAENITISGNNIEGFNLSAVAVSSKSTITNNLVISNNRFIDCSTLLGIRSSITGTSYWNGIVIIYNGYSIKISDNNIQIASRLVEPVLPYVQKYFTSAISMIGVDMLSINHNHIKLVANESEANTTAISNNLNIGISMFLDIFKGENIKSPTGQIHGNLIEVDGLAIVVTGEIQREDLNIMSTLLAPNKEEQADLTENLNYSSTLIEGKKLQIGYNKKTSEIVDVSISSAISTAATRIFRHDFSITDNLLKLMNSSNTQFPFVIIESRENDTTVIFNNNVCRSEFQPRDGQRNVPFIQILTPIIVANSNNIHAEGFSYAIQFNLNPISLSCIGNLIHPLVNNPNLNIRNGIYGPLASPIGSPPKYIYNNSGYS